MSSVRVQFVGPMRDATNGTKHVECQAASVDELLDTLQRQFGDGFDKMARKCRIVVNGSAIQFLQGRKTALKDGDSITMLMPVGGG